MTFFKKNGLNIVVAGCDTIGYSIIEQLSHEGHNITVVDKNPENLARIEANFDVQTICGTCASFSVLKNADVASADIFIAVTGNDEKNILSCVLAKQIGNPDTIAAVVDTDYGFDRESLKARLGISTIVNPALECSKEINKMLSLPKDIEVEDFAHGGARLVKFKVDNSFPFLNMAVKDIRNCTKSEVIFCSVDREGKIIIPNGDFVFKAGDEVLFVSSAKNSVEFFKELGYSNFQSKNVLIIGGGRVAYCLCQKLSEHNIKHTVIEKETARCDLLSRKFPKTDIIHGDVTDEKTLLDAGIKSSDAIVCVTHNDEINLLTTFYAKHISNAKCITKVDKGSFNSVITDLNIGSIVVPKELFCEKVIAFVRAKYNSRGSNLRMLYYLFNKRAVAMEFAITDVSKCTNKPIKNLNFKNGIIIASITRNGSFILPNGNDEIKVGDSIIVVSSIIDIKCLDDILR